MRSFITARHGFPAAFTGVDIFFVISGYLITGILWSELSRGTFSLVGFYARRFRRIIPALLTMVVVTLAAGSVLLAPDMYATVARSAAAAALGLGNIFFFYNTGYFAAPAKEQPFLHTWSLGVEEQFYIVWPLLLAAVAITAYHSRRAVVVALGALIAGSFAASLYYIVHDIKWAFYGPVTRAWELGLGALLVFIPPERLPGRKWANGLSLVGIALIAWSLFALDEHSTFPGPNALFACIGAALLILPQRQPTLVARALAVRPMVMIGLLSYSLYLWHWPVLVMARQYNNAHPLSVLDLAALLGLSLALAWLTWRYVERPFRRSGAMSPGRTVGLGLAAIAAACSLAFVIVHHAGFPARLPEEARRYYDIEEMWRWSCPAHVTRNGQTYCSFGADWESAGQRAILYGDSKAEHLAPLLHKIAAQENVGVILLNGCPAQLGGGVVRRRVDMSGYSEFCAERRSQLLSLLASEKPGVVLFSASWSYLGELLPADSSPERTTGALVRKGIDEIMPDLQKAGATVWLLGDIPDLPVEPVACAVGAHPWFWRRDCPEERQSASAFLQASGPANAFLADLAGAWPNLRFHSLGVAMCNADGGCLTRLNGEPLYRDRTHFRRNLQPETMDRLAHVLGLPELFATREEPAPHIYRAIIDPE